jgi:hypothetical protein
MKKMVVATVILCWVVLVALPATAQEEFRESYTARVLNMATTNPPIIPTGVTTTINITITRWTTDKERASLLTELIEKGQDAFIKALRAQEETGFVRITGGDAMAPGFPSERLRYARQIQEGETRELVLALDRPISFFEATERPRTYAYNFTLIVLDLDKEGKGEGSLSLMVKLGVDHENKRIIVENYGTEPLRLGNIRRTN